MQKNKFTKKETAVLISLAALAVIVIAVGAILIINNMKGEGDASAAATTAVSTTVTEGTAQSSEKTTDNGGESGSKSSAASNSSSSSSRGASSSSSRTASKSKASSKTASKSSSKTTSRSKTSSKKSSSTPIKTITPSANTSHASDEVCTINGTKCYVGDTVTLVLNLKTPCVLENFQGETSYDGSYLKFVSAKVNVNGIINNSGTCIYYNGSDIGSGFDFTKKGTLYTAAFQVKKAGSTTISNKFQVMSDQSSKPVKESDCKVSLEVFD